MLKTFLLFPMLAAALTTSLLANTHWTWFFGFFYGYQVVTYALVFYVQYRSTAAMNSEVIEVEIDLEQTQRLEVPPQPSGWAENFRRDLPRYRQPQQQPFNAPN